MKTRQWIAIVGLVCLGAAPARALVLDWSTYFGGSNDSNFCSDVGTDAAGRIYAVGVTNSDDLPTTNAFQAVRGGGKDVFVLCYDPAITNLVYATYLGGADEDIATGLVVADDGNVFVTGSTRSDNFPVVNPVQPTKAGGPDAFLLQLDPTGTNLVFSTYYGGGGVDEAHALARDAAGNLYLTGYTESAGFPTVNAFQNNRHGVADAFVVKILAGGVNIGYSTFLGGAASDNGLGVDVSDDGSVVVTGSSFSSDFPTKNPVQGNRRGLQDAFVTRFTVAGTDLVFSTYLGGGNALGTVQSIGNDVAIDTNLNVYVVGGTSASSFPVKDGFDESFNGMVDAFLVKYDDGGAMEHGTLYGGNGSDFAFAVGIASNGNIVVAGQSDSTNLPEEEPLQDGLTGGSDVFLAVFDPPATTLKYASYLGGKKNDYPQRLTVAEDGAALLAGGTMSGDFPLAHPLQSQLLGSEAGFIARILPSTAHDLAIQKLKVPKKVTLKTGQAPKASKVSVQLVNLSHHDEVVASPGMLSNLVSLAVGSLGGCTAPAAILQPPSSFPIIWPAGGKLKVNFTITFECANDPLQGAGFEDYQISAAVDHTALDGNADTLADNDVCPRDPSGNDKGCGNKDPVTKQLGADVLTDAVVK